jgi:HlyD family secretion protein
MKRSLFVVALAAAAAGWLYASGHLPGVGAEKAPKQAEVREPVAPTISVATVAAAPFRQSVQVTGTLVPREEILIAPEIEGYRLVEVLTDEGARVEKGQVLARLETATLEAQLAQNDATIARSAAAIAQAESQITTAEARVEEARNSLNRAEPLRKSGYLSESTFDQREALARTADAALVSARDGLKVATAEKSLAEAQRRELVWKMSRTEIKAPAAGMVSQRNARIGALASSAGEPLFRIIAGGEVELDAEVPEVQLAQLAPGQSATVMISGLPDVSGRVRLVSPEIDRATRLGRVRILLDPLERPRVGSFARGTVTTAERTGLSVPASAVLFQAGGARVQIVVDDRIVTKAVKTGLSEGDRVEIVEGLGAGDRIVTKAGTFLRDGDRVRPVASDAAKVSEAR